MTARSLLCGWMLLAVACAGKTQAPRDSTSAEATGGDLNHPGFGKLRAEQIQAVVMANWLRFKECYAPLLVTAPDAEGLVQTALLIGEDGAVQRAWDASAPPNDLDPVVAKMTRLHHRLEHPLPRSVVDCVAREFAKLRFPAPSGGPVAVVYPISFSPG